MIGVKVATGVSPKLKKLGVGVRVGVAQGSQTSVEVGEAK